MSKHADPVTVVIPIHNAADRLDRIVGWRMALEKSGRGFELLIVDDGSTDGCAESLSAKEPRAKILRHENSRGFGACLRTALAEARHPLFFYTDLNYPYTPSDIRLLFDRIDLKDEFLGRRPDLISGCRTGLATPAPLVWTSYCWHLFWRIFAGMPMQEPQPWHGWRQFWHRTRASWVFGVPMADVNSCFKLYRTAFLKRFTIQSDGDFVHTELIAKATFLTSIMDEVALTPKADAVPAVKDLRADCMKVFKSPRFAITEQLPDPGNSNDSVKTDPETTPRASDIVPTTPAS